MNSNSPVMKVNEVVYTQNDINKIVYYFQNKNILQIVWYWIRLRFGEKVVEKEIVPWEDSDPEYWVII